MLCYLDESETKQSSSKQTVDMRFSIEPPAYILLLLLASLANLNLVACSDGSDAMKKLCSSLSRATSCKASFKIPTFKVRTGKTDWFVGSKSVDACSLARQAIPGLEQLAQKSGAICTCLPEVRLVVPTDSCFHI
jgi:hypothetical protein